MLADIATDTNVLAVLVWAITGLLGLVGLFAGWQVNKLITNLDRLDNTVTENNAYQKQHFEMLKKHESKLENHGERLVKLEMTNGRAS